MAMMKDSEGNIIMINQKTDNKKSETKTTKKTKKTKTRTVPEPKTNTMNIKLINSKNVKITAKGHCTDKEIKAVCKALNHTGDQVFEAK